MKADLLDSACHLAYWTDAIQDQLAHLFARDIKFAQDFTKP